MVTKFNFQYFTQKLSNLATREQIRQKKPALSMRAKSLLLSISFWIYFLRSSIFGPEKWLLDCMGRKEVDNVLFWWAKAWVSFERPSCMSWIASRIFRKTICILYTFENLGALLPVILAILFYIQCLDGSRLEQVVTVSMYLIPAYDLFAADLGQPRRRR